jgi:hypothetical protein
MGRREILQGPLDKPEGKILIIRLGVDGIILKMILMKWRWRPWTGLMWFRIGKSSGRL